MESNNPLHTFEPTEYRVSKTWMLWWVAFWLIGAGVASMTAIVPLIAVPLIFWAVGHYLRTTVILDQHSVTLRRRLITTTEKRFPIRNIHAISTSIGPLGQRLDYGTLVLSVGNDRTTIKIRHLEGCEDLKDQLDHLSTSGGNHDE
jgi:membrane protein YdbS with pleckstrin-like domain